MQHGACRFARGFFISGFSNSARVRCDAGLYQRPHQALAHLRSGFACECDRYNFLGFVDAREQPEIALDQKSRFSRPGGCLNNKRLAGIKDTKALGQVRGIGVRCLGSWPIRRWRFVPQSSPALSTTPLSMRSYTRHNGLASQLRQVSGYFLGSIFALPLMKPATNRSRLIRHAATRSSHEPYQSR